MAVGSSVADRRHDRNLPSRLRHHALVGPSRSPWRPRSDRRGDSDARLDAPGTPRRAPARSSEISNETARASGPQASAIASTSAAADDALVGAPAVGPLVVLLDEAAPGDRARAPTSSTSSSSPNRLVRPHPKQSSWWTSGHRLYFSRNALIRTSYCWASREYTP